MKQKRYSERCLRKALSSSRCTSSTGKRADDPGVQRIGCRKKAYAVQRLRDAYNQCYASLSPALFGKLTAWRFDRAVHWSRGWTMERRTRRRFYYVWAWVTAGVLVKGAGSMLPLLSRISTLLERRTRRRGPLVLDGRTGRRAELILARRTRRWLVLVRRWASGRMILGRGRPGGRCVSWSRRKVWERGRIGVWGREPSWTRIPVEQTINYIL